MIVIFGRGGHANAIVSYAQRHKHNAIAAPWEDVDIRRWGSYAAIVGVGCSDMPGREMLYRRLSKRRLGVTTLVHGANAGASVGDGTVVFDAVTLGAKVTIGCNVVIYSGAVVEHDSVVGDHAWLSPGVILCGGVTVKPRAMLGAGAIVLPNVTIGERTIIGAGAVIHHDVADGLTVLGPRNA